jgi:hypothetical protein
MDVSHDLAAFRCFVLGVPALCPAKFMFISAKEAGIVHGRTIRERGKGCETNINANSHVVEGQGPRFYFTGKAGIPIPNRIPLDVQGLYFAFDRAMLDYFDGSDFGEQQTMVEKFKTCLWVREAIVSAIAFEARIANLFSMCLHTSKVGLKSKINPCANFLQDLRVHLRQFWLFSLPHRQQFDSIEARDGFLLLLPGVLACRQSLIENPTTQLQRFQEFGSLALGWRKAKLKRFHLHVFLVFDVLFDYC